MHLFSPFKIHATHYTEEVKANRGQLWRSMFYYFLWGLDIRSAYFYLILITCVVGSMIAIFQMRKLRYFPKLTWKKSFNLITSVSNSKCSKLCLYQWFPDGALAVASALPENLLKIHIFRLHSNLPNQKFWG
jgi:hypothetical protein